MTQPGTELAEIEPHDEPAPAASAQLAALVTAVGTIACQVTGTPRTDPGEAFRRLGLTPAEAEAITSAGAG